MRKLLLILLIAVSVSSIAFGQTKMPQNSKAAAQIIAIEKAGWQA